MVLYLIEDEACSSWGGGFDWGAPSVAGCARKEIVSPDSAQIFHLWQRCVRRAYLMGTDPLTGIDHSHRRQWLLERLQLLVACFVIDVGFIAILSNHFHLIVRTSPRLVKRMGA